MKTTTFLHVARDAWWLLAPLLLIGLSLSVYWGSALPWLLAGLLCVGLGALARDADRRVPPLPMGLVAPVDGVIVHRRECHDPYLDRAAIRLSIRVNRLGVYYLRAPTEGTLMEVKARRQCRHAHQASWIQTDEGDDVLLVVAAGSLLGQRPCNAGFGQRVGQGRRCGPRRFARILDMYIPSNCRVEVELGQKVRAGTDVVATMVHNISKIEAAAAA